MGTECRFRQTTELSVRAGGVCGTRAAAGELWNRLRCVMRHKAPLAVVILLLSFSGQNNIFHHLNEVSL